MSCFIRAYLAYQKLAIKYAAIEPPTWALLLAQSCRSVGCKVSILDSNAENLSNDQILIRINELNPRIICLVVYGQNVNAGTANMTGAIYISSYLKKKKINIPISKFLKFNKFTRHSTYYMVAIFKNLKIIC